MITVVCGFGRCGSSMLMQMLHHGGMRCAGKWPSFEIKETVENSTGDWIHQYEGAAVKFLEPAFRPPKPGLDYRIIWLDRDMKQQAKSWIKLSNSWMGGTCGRTEVRRALAFMRKHRPRMIACINRLGPTPPLMLEYEAVLANRQMHAQMVAEFVGQPLNVQRMAAGVLKRSGKCANGMLEEKLKHMRLGDGQP